MPNPSGRGFSVPEPAPGASWVLSTFFALVSGVRPFTEPEESQ